MILLAMVSFSTFVSGITASVTRLRALKSDAIAQHFLLRKFLKENSISWDLSARITRYVDFAVEWHRRRTSQDKVHLLRYLTGPLGVELLRELYEPHMAPHDFFHHYGGLNKVAMRQLCYTGVTKQLYSKGDLLFENFSESHEMFFLISGTLVYHRPKGVGWMPSKPDNDSQHCDILTDILTSRIVRRRRFLIVHKESWFCEGSLWVHWVHPGTMVTMLESELLLLDSEKFRYVTSQHFDVFNDSRRYAQCFLQDLEAVREHGGCTWDLPASYFVSQRDQIVGASGDLLEFHAADYVEAYLQGDSDSDSDDDGDVGFRSPNFLSSTDDIVNNVKELITL